MLVRNETDKDAAELGAWAAMVCADDTAPPVVTVNVRVAWPVPVLFVALSVTVEVAAVVGVPEINPLVVFTDSPVGNPVAP